MLIYAQNSHSFLHLLVITCITIQSISVLYDTNNKLLLFVSHCPPQIFIQSIRTEQDNYHSQIMNISVCTLFNCRTCW